MQEGDGQKAAEGGKLGDLNGPITCVLDSTQTQAQAEAG